MPQLFGAKLSTKVAISLRYNRRRRVAHSKSVQKCYRHYGKTIKFQILSLDWFSILFDYFSHFR